MHEKERSTSQALTVVCRIKTLLFNLFLIFHTKYR